jgi:RNA recognition motif-containing protein
MENQSKIVCRKCNGPHLTIKCGKENENKVETQIKILQKETNNERKEYSRDHERKDFNKDHERRDFNKDSQKREYRKYGKVKMGHLPHDITEEELLELLADWGHVTRLTVLNYPENSNAYIDFRTEEQADYFVKAFDKTPCNYMILSVEKLLE